MKKLLIALPFVATASWAGTTLYTGNQTRAAYDDLIAQLDGLNGMQVSTESYTAGFAASRAVTAVRASDAPDSSVLFRLRHEISHSPIGLDDGGARVGAARIVTTLLDDGLSEGTRAVIERFAGGVPFVLESDVGFDRRVSNVLAVSPLSLDADGVVLELGAIRYDVDIDPAGRIVGTGDHAGLELALTDDDVTFSVAPGTERFELERVGDGVYTGTGRASFGRIDVASPSSGLSATLDDVTLATDTSLVGERLASGLTFAVGGIASPLPLDSLSFGVRLGGVDVAGMERFVGGAGELHALDPAALAPDEVLARFGSLYANLIAPGLSLDYDVAMTNAGGDVTASAGVLFEGDGSASGHDSMTTVGDLVRALRISATLDADAGALAMTPAGMFLAGDALAPWIVSNGVTHESALVVDDLILDVNGNPMSLEMMAGDLLSLPLDLSMLMMMADR